MYLITGVAGFIGFHFALMLLKMNKLVIGIDNINNYYDTNVKKQRLRILKKYKNFKFYKKDLSKKKSLNVIKKNFKKIHYVIHLAGQAGVRYSIINPWTYILNNQFAFINLLEFFKKSKNLKILTYASSSSVLGGKKTVSKPISIYAESKLSMENISNIYSDIYNIKIVGMRFFTVYGPYGRPDMSVYKFTKLILANKFIDVFNNGDHKRSFTYIDDIVGNIYKIIIKTKNLKKSFHEVVSIGNPRSVDLKKMIKLLEKLLGKKAKKNFLPLQVGDVKYTKAYVGNETSKYSFKFNTQIEAGLKKFVDWYQTKK